MAKPGDKVCKRKKRYGSKGDALVHAARYLRKNGADDEYGYYRVYRCGNHWHLTHKR